MRRSSVIPFAVALATALPVLAQRMPAAPAEPPAATPAPPPSQVLQSWRGGDGWLTELRRHPDGTMSCATAKSFADKGFGLFILRSGNVTLLSVVDQRQPFTGPATIRLVQGARAVGTFEGLAQGPALATVDVVSRQVKAAIDRLDEGLLDVVAAERQFAADMKSFPRAREQLAGCVVEMDLAKPGR